jgi:hypothetical protein
MLLNANIAKTLDGKFSGLPSSNEFLACHRSSQVSTFRELAARQKRRDDETCETSHQRWVRA